jgi:hypothetical protein
MVMSHFHLHHARFELERLARITFKAALIVMAFLVSSCGPRFERTKFEPTYRAGKAIEGAIEVGVNYPKLSELTQTFATELNIATEAAKTESEKEVASAYAAVLPPLKDSLTVWTVRIREGNIFATYGSRELVPLMDKYNIKPVHEYKGGQNYDGENALRDIWADATKKLTVANDLLSKKSE